MEQDSLSLNIDLVFINKLTVEPSGDDLMVGPMEICTHLTPKITTKRHTRNDGERTRETGKMKYLVHNAAGELLARVKYAEDAAVLIAALGDGSTIRNTKGETLWYEGNGINAADSYDEVAYAVSY